MPAYVIVDVVVLEFPTLDAARSWWASPEYRPAKELRQSCADTEMLLVEGYLDSR